METLKKSLDKITNKRIFHIMLLIFGISIIPIIMLAFYNYPCADDFSASDTAFWAWQDAKSIFAVIKAAWENVVYNYMEWSGVFMSVFWTSLQFGIFGERYYGITTLLAVGLFIFGGFYLGHVIFDKYLNADKYITRCIVILYLFTSIQCMPDGNEGLYWHAGVVNYTWAFSFLLMLLGLFLSINIENNKKYKVFKTFLACVLAVFVGGGNYITALQGSVLLVFLLLLVCIKSCNNKQTILRYFKDNVMLIFPTISIIVAFVISVLAPGNKVRGASMNGFGAIKSILVSFYCFLDDPFEKWITWVIVISIAMVIPFMWQTVEKVEFTFKYPGVVALLGYCLASSAYTPSLYAQGEVGAGRLTNTVFLIWILILYAVVFYMLGWLNKILITDFKEKDIQLSNRMKVYIIGLSLVWFLCSGLAVLIDENTYICTSAGYAIISGQAQTYREENEYRLKLLKSDVEEVVVPSFSSPPELLLFQDIHMDKGEWLNQVMAEYYKKESVRRE